MLKIRLLGNYVDLKLYSRGGQLDEFKKPQLRRQLKQSNELRK